VRYGSILLLWLAMQYKLKQRHSGLRAANLHMSTMSHFKDAQERLLSPVCSCALSM
jgi:hypothetical protein